MAKKEAAAGKDRPRPMTKNQIVARLAEKGDVSKKQASTLLDELVTLAYDEAKKTFKDKDGKSKSVGFTIPGLGKLILREQAARKGRNPQNPAVEIDIPAKTVVKFRVAKAAKEAIVGAAAAPKKKVKKKG